MSTRRIFVFALGLALLLACFTATPIAQAAPGGEKLTATEARYICFVNKKHFEKPQTPVTIEGKTYYYCCDDCKTTMQTDAKSRMAVDPVSKKEIDKADAKIGFDSKGNVYFFENEANLEKYRVTAE